MTNDLANDGKGENDKNSRFEEDKPVLSQQ